MSVAAVVATHLEILRDQCSKATEKLKVRLFFHLQFDARFSIL
jgi:hypothetical protein